MIYIFIAVAAAIVGFIWWRYTSVARGAQHRDRKLLEALGPIEQRLANRELVSTDDIAPLARQPQYRPMLYAMLRHHDRLDLFPAEFLTDVSQGEGALVYWMLHPNELQQAPSAIELVERVTREWNGGPVTFLVFRYRMPAGHWAERYGWILGLAGPFTESSAPYSERLTGFSRCDDSEGKLTPAELVDWWLGVLKSKAA